MTESPEDRKARHTPGPFWHDLDSSTVFRTYQELPPGAQVHEQCIFAETMADAERDELVDLLNKGTHFDEMLGALKHVCGWREFDSPARWQEAWDKVHAAIAKAEGETK